jgi:hypothetical protein
VDPFTLLFSESAGRVIVAVPRGQQTAFTDLCVSRDFPHAIIGLVEPGDIAGEIAGDREGPQAGSLEVLGQFVLPLEELRTAHTSTLPGIFASR